MHTEDSDSVTHRDDDLALPAIAGLRLIALEEPRVLHRRRMLRRRSYAAVLIERRRGDRRKAKPGIDGLLRTVLSDHWKA